MTSGAKPVAGLDISEDLGPKRSAVAELFRKHNKALVRCLAIKLRSNEEAVEVAQEAYARILRLDEPHVISYLRAFLFRTAFNIATDRQRRQTREYKYLSSIDGQQKVDIESPESILVAADTAERLRLALEDLPPKCRHAFMRYQYQGHDYKAIADEMQLTESMIRKYVLRALVYCKEQLGYDK